MKKSLLLLSLISLSILNIKAQNFSYPIGQNLIENVININSEDYNIDIETQTPQAVQYEWELISNTFPATWTYSLCDYVNCHIGVPTHAIMSPITLAQAQSGVIGFFKLNLVVGQNYGQGKIMIYVHDSNNPSIGDTVSWDVTNSNTASIDENLSTGTLSYPNPSKGFLQFEHKNIKFNYVELVSISGKIAYSAPLNSNNGGIETSSFEAGVYYLNLKLENGETFRKKVILE
jgi:hypothetical protein